MENSQTPKCSAHSDQFDEVWRFDSQMMQIAVFQLVCDMCPDNPGSARSSVTQNWIPAKLLCFEISQFIHWV